MQIAQRIIAKVSVLSNLQQRFLVMVTQSILFCRRRVNFLALARVSGFNEKTFRRHFALPLPFGAVHRAVIDSVLPLEPPGFRVIAFDPTFLPKSSKHTEGMSLFWNGSENRVERGLEATVAAVVEVRTRKALTLAVRQTIVPDDAATSKTATKDKTLVDEYLRHISAIRGLLADCEKHIVVDGILPKRNS